MNHADAARTLGCSETTVPDRCQGQCVVDRSAGGLVEFRPGTFIGQPENQGEGIGGGVVNFWLVGLLAVCPITLRAQLAWVPEEAPQMVFAGEARKIRVTFSNPTDKTVEVQIRTRLFQASSATAMPLGPAQPWKRLQVLPGQKILESASVTFPAVKAGTRILVQWLDEKGKVLGPTEVIVQPPGLLKELKSLVGEESL